eukprot:scaffold64606_cov59-Phaeocystis_antarctica.AAC.1
MPAAGACQHDSGQPNHAEPAVESAYHAQRHARIARCGGQTAILHREDADRLDRSGHTPQALAHSEVDAAECGPAFRRDGDGSSFRGECFVALEDSDDCVEVGVR